MEGHECNDASLMNEMNNHFEPRRSRPPYSYFPAEGYFPLIQESSLQNDSTSVEDVNQRLKDLEQAVAMLRQSFCERFDKLEQAISETQRYINNLVPWSEEVHEKLMEVLGESQLGPEHKQTREGSGNPQENNDDNIVR